MTNSTDKKGCCEKCAGEWSEIGNQVACLNRGCRVEEFPVKITLSIIVETMARVQKAAKEIEIAFAAHVPDPRIVNF